MTELTSTETHSTQTLQTITWPTTTSGEYDVSPSPVIWWIIGIVLPVFLALLIVAIVCAVKRKRVCFCQQRPRLDDVRPKASNQTVDCDALYDEVLNSSSAASRTPARLPSEYHDGATYMYLSINRPPASIRPQRNNESDRDYYVGFCDVSAYDYADDFHVRSVRLPSIREGSQRFPISSSLDVYVKAIQRRHSDGHDASPSSVAATPVTSTPHQSSMNGAILLPTATNSLDAAITAQTATFTSVGGSMTCTCNNCDDCLVIPTGAVNMGESFTVTMDTAPSFICTQHEPSDGYHLFAIKEFTEVGHRHFDKHVQIVLHYSLVTSEEPLANDDLRIRFSTVDNKHFATAACIPLGDFTQQQNLPDVFYTFDDTVVTVYTTHFTKFKYESKKLVIGKCTSTKLITLVADVYGRKMNGNNSVEICVYVRDTYNEEKAKAQLKADDEREHSNFRHSLGSSFPLTKLPATISADTQFDCYLSFLKTLWKEFDLEEIAIATSSPTTTPANILEPGCTMPRSMKAKDILLVPAHTLQPFGPFILKSTTEQLSSCIEACANIVVEHDESKDFVTSTIQINAAL